jgi:GTPase SAR1 family protein
MMEPFGAVRGFFNAMCKDATRMAVGINKKKICLLGTFSVGKTSLVERFVHERFQQKYLTTVGINVSQKLRILMSDE